MVEIKIATNNDVEILALLGRVTYSESHAVFINNKADLITYNNDAFSTHTIKESLKDTNNIYFIAYNDDFPVGYAKLILNSTSEKITSNNGCQLEKIYVLNEFLGKKIGLQLLNSVIEKTKELNFDILWLTTYIKNEKAINFYLKKGFNNVGSYTFFVNGKGFENIIFSKEIQ